MPGDARSEAIAAMETRLLEIHPCRCHSAFLAAGRMDPQCGFHLRAGDLPSLLDAIPTPVGTYGEQIEALKTAGVLVWAGTLAADGRLQHGPWIMQPGGVDLYRITDDPQLLAQGPKPAEAQAPWGCSRCDTGEPCDLHDLLARVDQIRDECDGQPRMLHTYDAGQLWDTLNGLASAARRLAEAPQPRVLWSATTYDSDGDEWFARPGKSFVCHIEVPVPPGTRVVVIQDSAAPAPEGAQPDA